MLAQQAGLMAFVPPQPGQREVIYYDPSVPMASPEDGVFDMARRDAPAPPDPLANESRAARDTLPAPLPEAAAPAPAPVPAAPVASPKAAPAPATAPHTPVALALDDSVLPEPDVGAERPAAAAEPAKPAVLDLPDDTYREEPPAPVDAGMGELESL